MSSLLEQSLDEIIESSPSTRRGAPRRPRGSSNKNSKRLNSRQNSRNNHSSYDNRGPDRNYRSHGRHRPLLHLPADQQQTNQGAYLRVSNLHPELTEGELTKLFSGIGPLSFVNLQFNTRGESTGIAFIGYEHPNDCRLAVEKFDGRRAAGQIISVENAVPLADRIGLVRQTYSDSRGGRSRGRGSRGPKSRGAQQSRPKVAKKSVEELDAELNNYMGGQTEATESTGDDGQPPHFEEHQQEEQTSNQTEHLQQQDQAAPFPSQDNGEMAMD